MATSPIPLVCKACGYANESQRVYCHNCGVKLDREMLIPPQEEQEVHAKERHREVQKIMSPSRGRFARGLKTLCKTLALAALAGGLVDAVLVPEGVTAPSKKEEISETLPIDTILEGLVATHNGKRILFREADVNAYLRKERFRKLPSWITDSIPLRALVHFEENVATFTLVANAWGHPLCASLSGNLKSEKGQGLVATCTGGSIGRLPLPAQLAGYAGGVVPVLLDSMKNERQLLGQVGSIEIGKQQIILSAPVAAAPGGAAVRPAIR